MDPYDLIAEAKPSAFVQAGTRHNPFFEERDSGEEHYEKVDSASSLDMQNSSSVTVTTGFAIPKVFSFTSSTTVKKMHSSKESTHKVMVRVRSRRTK